MSDDLREISISLDGYDDIFSDFDPRPYNQRELSEDFLKEIQSRYREDRRDGFEVHFNMPASQRDVKAEALIKKRLHKYFETEAKETNEEITRLKMTGVRWFLVGAALQVAFFSIVLWAGDTTLVARIIEVIFTPMAWFFGFTSVDKFVNEPAYLRGKQNMWKCFTACNFVFKESLVGDSVDNQKTQGVAD